MVDSRQVIDQLERYGLGDNEAKIYLFLLRQPGELSVVRIARSLKLGRTPVYNALDKLEDKGLVTKSITDSGHNFTANSPDHLQLYWKRKIHGVQRLGSQLPGVVNVLEGMATSSGYKSQVDYFTGRRGLEQITYNSLRAVGDLYIYETRQSMDPFVSKDTAEEFRQRWADQGTVIHQLTNHESIEDFTEIEEITGDLWDVRHLPPEVLDIKFEMVIYNDVCAMYSVDGREMFGVEIHNPNLVEMQKQIFMAMRHLAKPLIKKGRHGEAHLSQ